MQLGDKVMAPKAALAPDTAVEQARALPRPPMASNSGSVTVLEMERQFRRLRARIVFIRDRCLDERQAWLRDLYGETEQYRYFENQTDIFSAAREGYDVFVAHAEDPVRLGKLLRRNRAILTSKIKVAVMAQSTPLDRAQLLNAGFDLVVDCRMHRTEYIARIAAIRVRMYRHALSVMGPLDDLRIVLRKYVAEEIQMDTIRNRELLLLSRLAARKNLPVHASELQKSAVGQVRELTRKSLCVAISRLRRKIAPQFQIVSDYADGYVLKDRTEH